MATYQHPWKFIQTVKLFIAYPTLKIVYETFCFLLKHINLINHIIQDYRLLNTILKIINSLIFVPILQSIPLIRLLLIILIVLFLTMLNNNCYQKDKEQLTKIFILDEIDEDIENDYHSNTQQQNNQCGIASPFVEKLTINKQRLMRYDTPLAEKRNYDNQEKVSKNHIHAKTNKMWKSNSSNSIKLINCISHRIVTSKIDNRYRLKTKSQKQNSFSQLLPKVKQKNFHIKPTIAITFKEKQQQVKNQLTQVKVNQYLPFQINNTSKQKKTLSKDYSLKKIRSHSQITQFNELPRNYDEISHILQSINKKQQQLFQQKNQLECKIEHLKKIIVNEQTIKEQSQKNNHKLTLAKNKNESMAKISVLGTVVSHKKNENMQGQTRKIEQLLRQASSSNQLLICDINEEKRLMEMYVTVIEEMKTQLKIEKRDKNNLQKRLAILKNNQKLLASKLKTQESYTRQTFGNIYLSLNKWK